MFSKLTESKKGEPHSVGYPFEQSTESDLNNSFPDGIRLAMLKPIVL